MTPVIIELAMTLDSDGVLTGAALTAYAADGCPRTVVELAPAATVTATTDRGRHIAATTWGVRLGDSLGDADLPLIDGGRRLTSIWALTPTAVSA